MLRLLLLPVAAAAALPLVAAALVVLDWFVEDFGWWRSVSDLDWLVEVLDGKVCVTGRPWLGRLYLRKQKSLPIFHFGWNDRWMTEKNELYAFENVASETFKQGYISSS